MTANVVRTARYMRTLADKTQFIVITHRRGTMEEADVLYGVTMQEQGVSKILTINLNDMAKELRFNSFSAPAETVVHRGCTPIFFLRHQKKMRRARWKRKMSGMS